MLAPLGVDIAYATDLSDAGEIVGNGSRPDLTSTGFRIPPVGPARPLHGQSPADVASPLEVSSDGTVAGYVDDGSERIRPVVWDAQDRATELAPKLPTYGGRFLFGMALGVNEVGQVVGGYDVLLDPPASAGPRAEPRQVSVSFVWDRATDTVTVLNPDAATSDASTWVAALAIGDSGVVLGTYESTLVRLWPQPGGGYRRELLSHGFGGSINASGVVVGNGPGGAVHWPADSAESVILPGFADGSGVEDSNAVDVTNAGMVAGQQRGAGGVSSVVRWPALDQPAERLRWDGREASPIAVNAGGTVVANGTYPGDEAGVSWRPLVWSP